MTQVLEALKWRYATKKFDAKRILSQDKIEIIKNAFNLTASSFGLQPVKLLIINNKVLQQKLFPVSMDQQQVVDASHLLIFCVEKNIDSNYVDTYFNNVKAIRNTEDEVLAPFKEYLLDHFTTVSLEDKNLWATKQAYITMGNLLTVCALEKIDACPMEGFSPDGYNEVLDLDNKGLRAVLVMPVGYRAEDDMFADLKKVRKDLKNAILEL